MLGKNGASTSKGRTLCGKSISVPSPDSAGCISLPHIKTQDLPKLQAALGRPQDSYLPTEDLDSIQLELENLLSTVALRFRYVKAEYETLDKQEDRREKKGKFMEKAPASPGKRKKLEEKNKRDGPSKMFGGQSKISKLKPHQVNSPAPSQHTDDSMDAVLQFHGNLKDNPKLSLPRNDTPNKFWLSVEPYCMPLTHEDIRLLDNLIEEYSDNLIPPIPELGPHFTEQWSIDDIKDEHFNKGKSKMGAAGLVKKSERPMGDNVTGPLTQRLVSALMEENLMPDNVTTSAENSNSGSDNTSSDFASNRSSLPPLKNGICIERRVRKELIDQGILDPDDFPRDDEILSEIKRVRTELSAIAEYNSNELKKLYTLAKDEMRRLELKRKLDSVDQEIIETYKKVVAAKQKRRELTKQERDDIFRLTEEQKKLSDQLEAMLAPGLNNTVN